MHDDNSNLRPLVPADNGGRAPVRTDEIRAADLPADLTFEKANVPAARLGELIPTEESE